MEEHKTIIDVRGMAPLMLVYDMPASLHFYCDILCFKIIFSAGEPPDCGWVLLRLNATEIMMEPKYPRYKKPASPVTEEIAIHSDLCIYFGCANVDAAYHYLREKGIEVNEPHVAPYGMKQLYLKDPDGYQLCFQWPVSEEAIEGWRKWYGFTG